MTITDASTAPTTRFELVALDLYRDIHKGIRSELFAVTESAGRADSSDAVAGADVAAHVRSVVALLDSHAEHEDRIIEPSLQVHLPAIAEQVNADHVAFERRCQRLVELADEAAATVATPEARRLGHLLYLDLAAFTGAYLAHQDLEERVLMPALAEAVGFEACLGMHQAIVGSIPPDEMARSLAIMLPAMNVDDRTELLGGMRAGAPAEVFDGVWNLAGSVLAGPEHAALAARLGL